MKKWAQIDTNSNAVTMVVDSPVEAEPVAPDGWKWIDVSDVTPTPDVEWVYDGTNFSKPAAMTNRETLEGKISGVLAGNATYMALSPPTAAQTTAQVRALTRQVNALLRLAGNQLDDISDS